MKSLTDKLGLKGGLKNIEKECGIVRPDDLAVMRGQHAVDAWRMWKTTGEERFLELLVKYNEEDVINLKQLAEYAIPKLWEKTRALLIAIHR